MMGKNKILVGCLSLLLVLSVGYALFSDTITINGTATAKGEFELTTEVVDLNEAWVSNFIHEEKTSRGLVENPTIVITNNVVNTSVTLGMPGSYQYFGIRVTNTGTIPAKLSSIIDKTNNLPILDKNLEINQYYGNEVYFVYQDENNRNENYIIAEFIADSGWVDDYTSDITAGERWSEFLGVEALDAVLDPGEETYYFIEYAWGGASTTPGEPLELNWQIEINWEQVTAN